METKSNSFFLNKKAISHVDFNELSCICVRKLGLYCWYDHFFLEKVLNKIDELSDREKHFRILDYRTRERDKELERSDDHTDGHAAVAFRSSPLQLLSDLSNFH